LPSASDAGFLEGYWPRVAEDPGPVAAMGIASQAWLEKAMLDLAAAEESVVPDGTSLVHADIRSD